MTTGTAAQRDQRFSRAERIISIGFWVNAVLMVGKLLAGHFGRSEAVFADGMESAADFVALGSGMVALRMSRKPHDEKHPYGHGRAESISAIIVSFVIFATGAAILARGTQTIIAAAWQTPSLLAVAAAAFTIVTKWWLYGISHRTGKHLGSPALLSVSKDHRKDALTSIATLIGVTGAFFGFPALDPAAAMLSGVFIFGIAWETFRDAVNDLMDTPPPPETVASISALAEETDGVEHVHELRCRRSGQYLSVDLKLEMDPLMTVKESHAIATMVKRAIFDRFPNVGDVMIHVNPHDDGDHEDLIRL
jgi:cation diffusion facilitator family transporter